MYLDERPARVRAAVAIAAAVPHLGAVGTRIVLVPDRVAVPVGRRAPGRVCMAALRRASIRAIDSPVPVAVSIRAATVGLRSGLIRTWIRPIEHAVPVAVARRAALGREPWRSGTGIARIEDAIAVGVRRRRRVLGARTARAQQARGEGREEQRDNHHATADRPHRHARCRFRARTMMLRTHGVRVR